MIVQLRIEDRLIHGQVALVWSKELNTPGMLVANDNAATNPTVKMTLKMACPVGKKVLIKTVDGAIETIKDPKSQSTRLLMMTRNCVDALRVVKACGDLIPFVNLPTPDILKQTERHADDIAAAKELVEILGDRFYTQMVPTTPKRLIKDLL